MGAKLSTCCWAVELFPSWRPSSQQHFESGHQVRTPHGRAWQSFGGSGKRVSPLALLQYVAPPPAAITLITALVCPCDSLSHGSPSVWCHIPVKDCPLLFFLSLRLADPNSATAIFVVIWLVPYLRAHSHNISLTELHLSTGSEL